MPHYDDEQLNKLQETLANRLTKADFESAFQKVLELVEKILQKHQEGISELHALYTRNTNELKGQVNGLFVEDKVKAIDGKLTGNMEGLKKMFSDNFSELSDSQKKELLNLRDNVSKTSLKKLQELDAKMKIIEGENKVEIDGKLSSFKEEVKSDLRELKEMLGKVTETRARGGGRRVPITRFVDLSSDVDGSATTFNLPPDVVRVYGVFSTQFPQIFNTTDWSRSGRVLTLNFTLQSGQSLIVACEVLFNY